MSVTERQLAVDPATMDVRSDPLVHVMRGGRVESVHRGHVGRFEGGEGIDAAAAAECRHADQNQNRKGAVHPCIL